METDKLGKYISIKFRSIKKFTKDNYKNNITCRLYGPLILLFLKAINSSF